MKLVQDWKYFRRLVGDVRRRASLLLDGCDVKNEMAIHIQRMTDQLLVTLTIGQNHWAAIGFVFNNEVCRSNMFNYAVSVDNVEALTGHDFFYNLPDSIERVIEANYNRRDW